MKEKWVIEAEQSAKDLAEIMLKDITDEADILCVDRKWFFEKVVQDMKAESEE